MASPGEATYSDQAVIDFNRDVQVDLLFWKSLTVMHMLVTLARFSFAAILPDRTAPEIIGAIAHYWFRAFGAPAALASDREGALDSDEARAWAARWQFKIDLQPRGSHARTVERHSYLLRKQLHLVDESSARATACRFQMLRLWTSACWRRIV